MKGRCHQLILLFASLLTLPVLAAQPGASGGGFDSAGARVTVNGAPLDAQELQALAAQGIPVQSGDFWYDPDSGLWGQRGGPAAGMLPAGLEVGAPLPADASGGQTDVFINGRAIHPTEYQSLVATYGQAIPGRYRLDGAGNFGVEGGPTLGNIHAGGAGMGGRPSTFHSGFAGTVQTEGNCTFINTPEASVLSSGC